MGRAADRLATQIQTLASANRLAAWRQRVDQSQADYEALQAMLAAQVSPIHRPLDDWFRNASSSRHS